MGLFTKGANLTGSLKSLGGITSPKTPTLVRQNFLDINVDAIISNLLHDCFATFVGDSAKVPIYPILTKKKGDDVGASLFEVCAKAITDGSVKFAYTANIHKGYLFTYLPPNATLYEAKSPYGGASHKSLGEVLFSPLTILYGVFNDIFVKQNLFDGKIAYYVHGLRDMFGGSKLDIKDRVELLDEQAKAIFAPHNNIWVIDGADRIDTPKAFDITASDDIRFAYGEISRIMGIPLTRLIGKSPDGMNATGEGDQSNYYLTLERLAKNLVLPIWLVAEPTATLKPTPNPSKMRTNLELLDKIGSLAIEPSVKTTLTNIILKDMGLTP